jgi:hypothetical protein
MGFHFGGWPLKGRKLYELYKTTEAPREWFPILLTHAQEVGITVLSSVFSEDDVDFLEGLDFPAYKIPLNGNHEHESNLACRQDRQTSHHPNRNNDVRDAIEVTPWHANLVVPSLHICLPSRESS